VTLLVCTCEGLFIFIKLIFPFPIGIDQSYFRSNVIVIQLE
jgi:hypothetical protein